MNYLLVLLIIILILVLIYNELIINLFSIIYNFLHCNRKCIQDGKYLLCQVENHKYFLNPLDRVVSDSIRNGNYWEQFMHKYFKAFSDKEFICLDIGANIGTHSVILSEYFDTVYCFEPQKDVFEILKKNIDINNCSNVVLYNCGLGKDFKNEKMNCFDITKPYNIGSIGINQDNNREGCEEVKIITLDSLTFTKPIKLIKIDIEGYEYNAFIGGKNTIAKYKPIIIFEEHKKSSPVFELLSSWGYNVRMISFTNDYIAIPE